MKLLLLAIAATLATTPARSAENVYVYGTGTFSCGKFVEARRVVGGDRAYRQWFVAFASGHNWFSNDGQLRSASHELDDDAAMVWIENYCRRQPTVGFVFAAAKFIEANRQ